MSNKELIELIVLACLAAIVVVYFLIMAIKNGWIKKLTKTLNDAIRYADKNIKGPKEKKKYVMDKIEEKCSELGIPYALIYKLVSKLIEKIIADHNIIDHDDEQL